MIEATCRRCGETFNPHDEDLSADGDTAEHYATLDGAPCGGVGDVTGTWR